MEYYTMTTNAGDQAIAHAIQTGTTTTFKQLAVGDGNGAYYEPAKTQTVLRREVWRGNAVVSLDANNPKRVIVTATIPATVGGFTIREAGIFDTTNAMMVVAKLPLSEKVAPESGASTDLVIRIYVEVSDASAVNITVDPSAVQAFKSDVDAAAAKAASDLATHAGNNTHITGTERTAWNGKANVLFFASTLSAVWTGSGPYTQTVSIPGILQTDRPDVSPVLDSDPAIRSNQRDAWNMVGDVETVADAVTFTCDTEKPTVEIPIQIRVVR